MTSLNCITANSCVVSCRFVLIHVKPWAWMNVFSVSLCTVLTLYCMAEMTIKP